MPTMINQNPHASANEAAGIGSRYHKISQGQQLTPLDADDADVPAPVPRVEAGDGEADAHPRHELGHGLCMNVGHRRMDGYDKV